MRAPTWLIGAMTIGVALTPGRVRAGEPTSVTRKPAAIVGGQTSEVCEWPSVVALRTGGLCTAALVHPRVVVYAAHCGTLHTKVLFGEDVEAPAREVPTLRCERNSDLFAVSSEDYAYCELAEAVEDIAITPLLFGCDEALIEVGTPVTIVGFGDTSSAGPEQTGIKHAAQTQIVGMLSTVAIGGMGTGADLGDSGGPALVELGDGSWRVLGIVSGGGGDGATVQYVPAPKIVAWVEDRTGIDITPCHASDGSWAPTPACEGLFVSTDPQAGASWDAGCPGPVSPPSQRCGPPWTSLDDSAPPIVNFIEPIDGATFPEGAPLSFDVLAEAEAEDGGVGVRELRLLVDGAAWVDTLGREAVDEVPPYQFDDIKLELDGLHTLTLEAIDHFDNHSSTSVMVMLGEEPGGETGDEFGTDTGAGAEEMALEPSGCSCASAAPRSKGLLGLPLGFLLGFLWIRVAAGGPRTRRVRRAASPRRR